jgi:hypothetical protein
VHRRLTLRAFGGDKKRSYLSAVVINCCFGIVLDVASLTVYERKDGNVITLSSFIDGFGSLLEVCTVALLCRLPVRRYDFPALACACACVWACEVCRL